MAAKLFGLVEGQPVGGIVPLSGQDKDIDSPVGLARDKVFRQSIGSRNGPGLASGDGPRLQQTDNAICNSLIDVH